MAHLSLAATLSVLRIVNLRAVRRHVLRAVLAAFSLGGGVAVVVAVMIEITSVSTAIDDVGYQIAGPAPLRVVGAVTRGGIDSAAIDAARTVPGVSSVVPVIRGVMLIRNGDREMFVLGLGIDCSAQWIIDPKVCQPGQREPPPVTSALLGQSLGTSATLVSDVGQLSMDRFQQTPQLDTVNDGQVVVLPLSQAKVQFARSGRVDMLYVTVSKNSNAAEIRERLVDRLGPGFNVQPRSEPARGYNVNSVLLPLLAIFALVAVGVGAILIAQITRLSIEERRREIAIAAALGASSSSIVTGFLAEAALLGAAGAVMGVLTGIVIARPVVASASELTEQFVGVTVPVVLDPGILVVGLGMGVLLAVLAAVMPSLSASNTPLAAELSGRAAQEQTKPRKIWVKTAALLAVGIAGVASAMLATASGGLELWQAGVADAGAVTAIVGLLLSAAYLSAQAIAAVRPRPDRAHGATLTIALATLRANGSRTAAISGAVAVPVVVVVLLSGFLVAINRSAVDIARSQAEGRVAVTTTRFADYGPIDARFSTETVNRLVSLPAVASVERTAQIEISLTEGSLAYVQAQDRPTFPFGLLAGQPPEASLDANQLVIGGILAREKGFRIGDRLLLGSGSEAREMVVGTILASPEYGGQRIYMSYRVAEELFGPQPAGLIFITPATGFTPHEVIADVKLAEFDQPVRAVDAAGYTTAIADGVSRYLTPLNTLKYGLLAIAYISVLSTLLLVGIRRRREVALVQALGATRLKVFRIATLEALIASAAGAIFGAVLSVAIFEAVRRAAIVNVGVIAPVLFPLSEAIIYAGLATIAAVFAAVIPAWRITQSTPAVELRRE